jgi:hypothetical protein
MPVAVVESAAHVEAALKALEADFRNSSSSSSGGADAKDTSSNDNDESNEAAMFLARRANKRPGSARQRHMELLQQHDDAKTSSSSIKKPTATVLTAQLRAFSSRLAQLRSGGVCFLRQERDDARATAAELGKRLSVATKQVQQLQQHQKQQQQQLVQSAPQPAHVTTTTTSAAEQQAAEEQTMRLHEAQRAGATAKRELVQLTARHADLSKRFARLTQEHDGVQDQQLKSLAAVQRRHEASEAKLRLAMHELSTKLSTEQQRIAELEKLHFAATNRLDDAQSAAAQLRAAQIDKQAHLETALDNALQHNALLEKKTTTSTKGQRDEALEHVQRELRYYRTRCAVLQSTVARNAESEAALQKKHAAAVHSLTAKAELLAQMRERCEARVSTDLDALRLKAHALDQGIAAHVKQLQFGTTDQINRYAASLVSIELSQQFEALVRDEMRVMQRAYERELHVATQRAALLERQHTAHDKAHTKAVRVLHAKHAAEIERITASLHYTSTTPQ